MKLPLVSIGLPVYNGGETIEKAILSLLAQTYYNIELVISENCSSDSTRQICQYYADADSRIMLHLQGETLSAPSNFEYVLRCASGSYFMWAAADDFRDARFVEKCLTILTSDMTCVAATSIDRIGDSPINTYELSGDRVKRINTFLDQPFQSYGLFYSITRTEVAKLFVMPDKPSLADDWKYICFLAAHGNILRTTDSLTVFGDTGLSNSDCRFSHFRSSLIDWLFPLRSFSRYTITLLEPSASLDLRTTRSKLALLNHSTALAQLEFEKVRCSSLALKILFSLLTRLIGKSRKLYLAWSLTL